MDHDTIVVGYDGSPGAMIALRWALAAARRQHVGVRLVRVVEWPVRVGPATPTPSSWPVTQAHRDAQDALDRALATVGSTDLEVPVAASVLEGPPAAVLGEVSAHARMLVLGDRGRGGFAGLLLGSVAVAAAAHATAPLVVVRGEDPLDRQALPVVVGVDDSPAARAAVATAFAEADSRGVELVALRAWRPPAVWSSLGRPRFDDQVDELEMAERRLLEGTLTSARASFPAVTATVRLEVAGAAKAIIDSSRGAQLVVVGSHGRGGFHGLLLGSVSQQVLHHAHCPVLVVRAPVPEP